MTVTVAGRLVTIRDMGKSQFVKILDQQGQIQLYVKKDVVPADARAVPSWEDIKADRSKLIELFHIHFTNSGLVVLLRSDGLSLVVDAICML